MVTLRSYRTVRFAYHTDGIQADQWYSAQSKAIPALLWLNNRNSYPGSPFYQVSLAGERQSRYVRIANILGQTYFRKGVNLKCSDATDSTWHQ